MSLHGQIYVLANFHYDVAYLKSYDEYLEICFRNLDEALRILAAEPEYRYAVEQVILLEEFWNRFPEKQALLRQYAREGRLGVAPGMYVMPDMNHPGGEAMFMQAKIGKEWLREHLGIDAETCWIADCWGHHAQLPQILSQAGYRYYAFWRCMRRDVRRNQFLWEGIDGTRLRTHWLARGYGNINFPPLDETANLSELSQRVAEKIQSLWDDIQACGTSETVLLCNGGDFMAPQASGPAIIREINEQGTLPEVRYSLPDTFMTTIPWDEQPVVFGEFNSAFHGTFTSNIRIKQQNRQLTNRLLSLESISVLQDSPREYTGIWKTLLKQQFHDIICGTICDDAVRDCLDEFSQARQEIDAELDALAMAGGVPAVCNTLSFPRTEVIEHAGKRLLFDLPPFSAVDLREGHELQETPPPTLPVVFENDFYRAEIGGNGYLTSLVEAGSGDEIIRQHVAPFGSLAMQIDNGDLWLNFESPLDGGSPESTLTQNHPDPYNRSQPGSLVNKGTMRPRIGDAEVVSFSDAELIVEQRGLLDFWRLQIPFTTRMRLSKYSPLISYETTIQPTGKHYRIRAAFPTTITAETSRHEIPFGIQERGEGEHIAQHWIDYADARKGLGLINDGTPGNSVHDGVMLLSLFRAVAMEYKAPSELSFGEGVPHTFRYAVLPHGASSEELLVKEAMAFAMPPIICNVAPERIGPSGWGTDQPNVLVSALRWSGDRIFARIYECAGKPATGQLTLPPNVIAYALADGLESPQEAFQACTGAISFSLRPFEIRGYLYERKM